MKVIIESELIQETDLLGELLSSSDRAITIVKGENVGKRGVENSEITKEIVANDSLELGTVKSAQINNVSQTEASYYQNGKHMSEETKTKILDKKYNIQDTAVTKLMETLNLIDPSALEKQTDIIRAAGQLASVVEKVSGNNKGDQTNVQLIFYSPKQKKESDYEIINVG